MESSLVPDDIKKDFGEYALNIRDIAILREIYPKEYRELPGETEGEKHLSFFHARIKTLTDFVEHARIEIGYLIALGNAIRVYDSVDCDSMEDYLISEGSISKTLMKECKQYYAAYLAIKEHGYSKEQIHGTTITQVDAITSRVERIDKQKKQALEERANAEGVSEFRRLPKDKKESIQEEVDEECERAIKEEVDYILNSPEIAHQVAASDGIKADRPYIIGTNVRLDPATGHLTWEASCYLEKSQITPFRKNNITTEYVLEGDPHTKLSHDQLTTWIKDALD